MPNLNITHPSGQVPSEAEGPSVAKPGNLQGKKVSPFHALARVIHAFIHKFGEFFRQILLAPGKNKALALLKEAKSVEMEQRLQSLHDNLAGEPVTLSTSNGLSVQGMYFNATSQRILGTKGRFAQGCVPTETNQVKQPAENGPTLLFFSGSDTSIFAKSYETTIQAYLERGVNVMVVDYPGVGKSKGFFSVYNSYAAAEAAYEFVQKKNVPTEKILVEGFSMGSGPASHLAAKHQGVNLLLRNPFVKMSEIGRERIRHDFPNPFMKYVIAPAVQIISQIALPYDNEKWVSQIGGPFGILTGGAKDMFNEQLQTRERLLAAYDKSSAHQKQKREAYKPETNEDARRTEIQTRYEQDSANLERKIANIRNDIAKEKSKLQAAQKKTPTSPKIKTFEKHMENLRNKTYQLWRKSIQKHTASLALARGRPVENYCDVHMLTYAESPELANRLDGFLKEIDFFS